ncbi:MAG: CrcB family protein [Haloplanus sp.]
MTVVAPSVLVATGGVLGALCRYELTRRLEDRVGTLAVNVLGSLALGFVTFAGVGPAAATLVGTGACGSFTTFSSFAFDTVTLWTEEGRPWAAAGNALLTLAAALVAVGVGWALARVV